MGCLFHDFEESCVVLSLRQMNTERMMNEAMTQMMVEKDSSDDGDDGDELFRKE